MLRRRTVFATPFVLVLGCSHPSDHTTASPQTKHDDAAQANPEDADERVDVKDPGPDVTASNPGSAGCVAGPGRTCNPPAPSHDRIIVDGTANAPKHEGEGLFFKVALDKDAEVTTHFTGVFLDDKGPIANTDFVVKNHNGGTLLCFLKGKEQLPSARVRIYEPGAR